MNEETVFRIIVAVVSLTVFAISGYHRTRARTGEQLSHKEEGIAMMRGLRLCGLAVLACVLAYIINPNWMMWSRAELPAIVRWIGVAICAIMVPMVFWTLRSLGKNITDTVVTRKNHTLVTTGPYRWIRHPLYTFGSLHLIGVSFMIASWIILFPALVGLLLLVRRTETEEAKLIERYGDSYREYMNRTSRFLPKFPK